MAHKPETLEAALIIIGDLETRLGEQMASNTTMRERCEALEKQVALKGEKEYPEEVIADAAWRIKSGLPKDEAYAIASAQFEEKKKTSKSK